MEAVLPNYISLELLKEITDGFSEHRMIGSRSFGIVYKGVLKDGREVAVKLLSNITGIDDKEFMNEHNNLIVSYMAPAKNRNRVLQNGILCKYISDEYHGHDWHTRYTIIKGICEELVLPFCHLKQDNILLGENTLLKVAKFVISRLLGEEQTRISKSTLGTLRSNNMDCVVPNNISLQLLEEITDGFSEHRMVGSGSSGKVYMGVHKDGKKIAVKLLYGMPGLSDEQFQNEFNYLKRLDHQNIVRLVGFCYETKEKLVNYNGKQVLAEKRYTALCLEYMNNGSLDNYITDECSGHSWSTRYKIIKGVCEGLKYLHEELKPPIYHLDLKPANILLDDNILPKISDFGLSKLFGEEQTQIIRNDRGTDAYSPPEYKRGGVVSMKFDIFSLGVVIMKIMAGRTGYCKSHDMSSKQFIEFVHGNWSNRLQDRSKYGSDMKIYSAQIKTCIETAVRCVEYDRNKRPNIGDIIHKLNETEMIVLLQMISLEDSSLNKQIFTDDYILLLVNWTIMMIENSIHIKGNSDLEIEKKQRDYAASVVVYYQQFQHVHRNGRNRPTSAEDRRHRNRQRPAEDRTRHMKSSSASSYTLMRNWKST